MQRKTKGIDLQSFERSKPQRDLKGVIKWIVGTKRDVDKVYVKKTNIRTQQWIHKVNSFHQVHFPVLI